MAERMDTMRNDWKIIKEAYEVLKKDEWRWTTDNDYRRKYQYVKEAATTEQDYTKDTVTYIADCALFLLDVRHRIEDNYAPVGIKLL